MIDGMSTWSAHATVPGRPSAVLDLLTDPDAIAGWAPVPFEIERLGGRRLIPGVRARVSGRLARVGASFDVAVTAADEERFALTATGPVVIDVEYELFAGERTDVWVTVGVRSRGGLSGRLLAQATETLLRAGALDHALARIAKQIEEARDDVAACVG